MCRWRSGQTHAPAKRNNRGFESHPVLQVMNMDDFKRQFWEWFDSLPVKAKRSYQSSHLDVAEEYFREFFYDKPLYARSRSIH